MTLTLFSRRSALGVLAVVAVAGGPLGCARPLGTVTGRVSYLDRPVTSGSVLLYCDGQQIVRGEIGPDGTYAIPNVPRGPARVAVVRATRMPDGWGRKYSLPPVVNGPITAVPTRPAKDAPAIPDRYGVPEESGLTLTVVPSANAFDIVLTR